MRTDYMLYVVAAICFLMTAFALAIGLSDVERNLSVVTTVVFGLLFVLIGLWQRPRAQVNVETSLPPPLVTVSDLPPNQVLAVEPPHPIEPVEPIVTVSPVQPIQADSSAPLSDLTIVKGIKAKRAEQLKSVGVNSVQDLANASSTDLAGKLKVAAYFTEKWIQAAKELVESK